MVKDDDCVNRGNPGKWYPYNYICHAVWAEVTSNGGWIHLEEAISRLRGRAFDFYGWPDEGEQP